jgi:hypothetical protein
MTPDNNVAIIRPNRSQWRNLSSTPAIGDRSILFCTEGPVPISQPNAAAEARALDALMRFRIRAEGDIPAPLGIADSTIRSSLMPLPSQVSDGNSVRDPERTDTPTLRYFRAVR